MEPIKNIVPLLKATMESRESYIWECKQGEQRDVQGVTVHYQGCGVIEPLELRPGRYIRKGCACEHAALARKRLQDERQEWCEQQVQHTYGWLGTRWADTVLATKSFEQFDRERQIEAYNATRLFMESLYGTLILHGTFGTGKTHLLAALCNALRQREKNPTSSLFVTAPKLFSAIQERIGSRESYSQLISRAIRTPLLVIDDIDKAKWSEFREEIYFEIIDERSKAGMPIAISTNRLNDLAQFVGGACASRLQIGLIEVEMTGNDYRRGM